jgi:hypothetical protein
MNENQFRSRAPSRLTASPGQSAGALRQALVGALGMCSPPTHAAWWTRVARNPVPTPLTFLFLFVSERPTPSIVCVRATLPTGADRQGQGHPGHQQRRQRPGWDPVQVEFSLPRTVCWNGLLERFAWDGLPGKVSWNGLLERFAWDGLPGTVCLGRFHTARKRLVSTLEPET